MREKPQIVRERSERVEKKNEIEPLKMKYFIVEI